MKNDLWAKTTIINYVEHLPTLLKQLCYEVLDDPRFWEAPGGSEHHHNYRHGLIIHTAEVLENAIVMSCGLTERQTHVLTTAAVWHDYHKIYDYSLDNEYKPVKEIYRKLIGHLAGSWAEFYHHARVVKLPEDLVLDIGHCMLAHHGRREWGSPVEPYSPLAFILHSADMLSMRGTNL